MLFLLTSVAIFLYFSPVATKEIKIEGTSELILEKDLGSSKKEVSSVERNKDGIFNDYDADEEKTIKTIKKDGLVSDSSSSIKIIQKSVSWGYSKPQVDRIIDTIIIHSSYNALGGNAYDLERLMEEYKEYGVSPHYLIDRKGSIYQLVSDKNIAFHAGESRMPDGRTNVNNFSLGIEVMNTKDSKPTEKQYQSLSELITYIKNSYRIKNVLGHNQIAPGRKTDPWNFEWKKL